MNKTTALLPESTANQWDRATYAFLAEKQRRSGSDRTVLPTSATKESLRQRPKVEFPRHANCPSLLTTLNIGGLAAGTSPALRPSPCPA